MAERELLSIRLADILQIVKDKKKINYVNENIKLNFNDGKRRKANEKTKFQVWGEVQMIVKICCCCQGQKYFYIKTFFILY